MTNRRCQMTTGAHLREDMLVDYADGRVEPAAGARVESHLESGCEACAGRLVQVRRQLAVLAVYRAPVVPATVRQRLLAAFDGLTPAPTFLERLVAALKFDSRLQPALVGVREGQPGSGSLQLLYET